MTDYSDLIRRFFGTGTTIAGMRRVSGGDINEAYLLVLSDGRRVFLKENAKKNAGFFRTEQEGLAAIRKTGTNRVPGVWEAGTAGDRSFLLMEYLEEAPAKKDFWEVFGRQLARMHKADASEWTPGGKYGFTQDNYIGAGGQVNAVRTSWIAFFRECRLEVQFLRALEYFDASGRKAMQSLLDHLDRYLTEPAFPSLLHGDLWGGNYVRGPEGYACLIDPAVSVGHAEADLAMTELFGGFAPAFYDAYRGENEIRPGYSDRRDLYNLYHLLNHLNLFGGSYYSAVMRIVKRYR
jgi:fructosamine-3-kinase